MRAILIAAATVAQVTAQGAVTLRTIEKGAQSNVDDARRTVARTPAEWAALWKAHNYDKPAPAVDFANEMIVAVFMGSRPTAGFAVEIAGAAVRDGGLVVTYRESMPPPGMIAAQVLTSPYHIAAVPKQSGDVRFEKAER